MIHCKELDKDFNDKESMFKYLKSNEKQLILIKSANEYKSVNKGQYAFSNLLVKKDVDIKVAEFMKDDYIYPVINTTRYMDSHDDVHFDGIWKKSIQEQANKIFYVSNHNLTIDDVIAWPEDVAVKTIMVDWSLVGKDYLGQTEALIFEIAKKDIKKQSVINAIIEKRALTGSVRMRYIKVKLALDSENPDNAENKRYFDERINTIANKEMAIDLGYFFGIEEAKIVKEGSLELNPSNDATNIIYNIQPPVMALSIPEPSKKTLNYSYLINNLTKK